MTKKYLWLITLLALVLLAILIGYQTLYPEERNILKEKAAFSLSAELLGKHFAEENGSRFIDQAIVTFGNVTEIDKKSIVLDDRVQVSFVDFTPDVIEIKDSLAIKGRCIGYDDLLEMVKIDQATITN